MDLGKEHPHISSDYHHSREKSFNFSCFVYLFVYERERELELSYTEDIALAKNHKLSNIKPSAKNRMSSLKVLFSCALRSPYSLLPLNLVIY